MASLRSVQDGLEVIAKYMDLDNHVGGAEHDVLYVLPPDVDVSTEDEETLTSLGWHYDDEHGWAIFV